MPKNIRVKRRKDAPFVPPPRDKKHMSPKAKAETARRRQVIAAILARTKRARAQLDEIVGSPIVYPPPVAHPVGKNRRRPRELEVADVADVPIARAPIAPPVPLDQRTDIGARDLATEHKKRRGYTCRYCSGEGHSIRHCPTRKEHEIRERARVGLAVAAG